MTVDRIKGPEIKEVDHIEFVKPLTYSPGNGIDVFEIGGMPEEVLQIEFQFNAGRKHQEKCLQASLTMEMLLEGSDGREGSDIMDELDGYGAYIDTSVELDRSTLTIFCMNRGFEKVMDLVMKILYRPNFKSGDFETVRDRVRQNFLVESEKVSVLARRAFIHGLFENTAYGFVAKKEDFDAISLEDCRTFHSAHIANGSMKVFVSGNVTPQVSAKMREILEPMKLESPDLVFDSFDKTINGTLLVEKQNAMQSGIRKGKKSIKRDHPDFPELQVLVTVLGGYFGSRLMMNIREDKGYTYGIGAGLASYDHCGMLYIATEVGSAYLKDTQVQISHEIDVLHTELIPDHELMLVKNYLRGSLARSADGAFAMMDKFKSVHNSGLGLDYYDYYMDRVGQVSSERLRALAQTYLSEEDMLLVIAG